MTHPPLSDQRLEHALTSEWLDLLQRCFNAVLLATNGSIRSVLAKDIILMVCTEMDLWSFEALHTI